MSSSPDIVQSVSAYVRQFGWPNGETRLGPLRCDPRCRTKHAWAWNEVIEGKDGMPPLRVFRYFRPHNVHDTYQNPKNPVPEWLKSALK